MVDFFLTNFVTANFLPLHSPPPSVAVGLRPHPGNSVAIKERLLFLPFWGKQGERGTDAEEGRKVPWAGSPQGSAIGRRCLWERRRWPLSPSMCLPLAAPPTDWGSSFFKNYMTHTRQPFHTNKYLYRYVYIPIYIPIYISVCVCIYIYLYRSVSIPIYVPISISVYIPIPIWDLYQAPICA